MKINLLISGKLDLRIAIAMLFCSLGVVQAQNGLTIKGKVSGDGGSLPGVSVIVKDGKGKSTITDLDGNYQIRASESDVISFSYIGFITKNVKVEGRTIINIELKSSVNELDNIVIVGYGTQKKKEVTGAVAQLKGDDLIQNSTSDLGQALQGQITGVSVTASSGEPGSESNISIRGLSSILGYNGPLYVVDGIPQDGNPNLSNNEIETIDVLKDASSAAIYGTRGAGGVILITTKKGKEGKMKIKIDSYYGVQHIYSDIPKANFEEDLYIRFVKAQLLNGTFFNNTFTPLEQNTSQFTNSTNAASRVLVQNAPIQNHTINVSGGKQGATYSLVGTYFNQEGSVINSGYDRFNLRANSQLSSGKWTVSSGFSARIDEKKIVPGQLLTYLYSYHPYQADLLPNVPVVDEAAANGTSNDAVSTTTFINYLNRKDSQKGTNFTGNLTVDFDLTKSLKITSRSGFGYTTSDRETVSPNVRVFDVTGTLIPAQIRSSVYNSSGNSSNFSQEAILNYKKTFGNHNISALAVYSAEQYKFKTFSAQKFDLFSNDIGVINNATSDEAVVTSGSDKTNTLIGNLARLQYNYKGRYLLSISARRDGSSRFGSNNRYKTFPSFSAGWNVSDEDFWKPIKSTVDNFKLRISQGTTGNQGLPDYSYAGTITLRQDYPLGTGTSQTLGSGATQVDYANPDIKWETSSQTNFGYDMSFLKNKLTFTADLYKTVKKDLLLATVLPNSTGAMSGSNNGTLIQNVGDMQNMGLEYAVSYKSGSKKVKWNTTLNFSKNVNKVTKLNGNSQIQYLANSQVVLGVPNEDLVSAIAIGHEAGSFFLIKTDGVINNQPELDDYRAKYPNLGAQLGDIKLVDALTVDSNGDGIPDKGDGIIDLNDRQYAGSGLADFELGWNFSANYKNFDFSMQWFASVGGEVLNGSKAAAYKSETSRDLVYTWSPQNPNSNIPANRGRDYINFRGYTDYWMEDGTFARMKNIQIGYAFPKSMLQKLAISKLRVYIAAQNLVTLTKYSGFDPEVGNNGLSTRGIDRGNYPISSQVRAGLQFEF
ncbi:SusC/RagA family TonB-linked outer membrane protein [Flavobacterium faecale]|uniref:SusC/RagA family TonB-linked outer membrane protein n=1 Tax=Flavobacterium faecale TaxID=1355330 RepID=A0A2S1LGN3_9FLAO|nr:TonB-dependent receptor [Flavobacterium faecale]AWG22811.1 SusC/RagA family TonB-linked outer membrane protein [Flavobacterium faecale]